MSEVRVDDVLELPVTTYLPDLRARADALAKRITIRVQTEVASYAGSESGGRHALITEAVTAATEQYFRTVTGKPVPAGLDDLFRRMGYAEAAERHDLTALQTALRLATREAWRALRDAAIDLDLPTPAFAELSEHLFTLMDHLREQVGIGHELGVRARDRDVHVSRRRLLGSMLAGHPLETLTAQATAASWDMPEEVVVAAVTSGQGEAAWPSEEEFDGRVLLALDHEPGLAVIPRADMDTVVSRLRTSGPAVRVSHSWPVPPVEASAARRWAQRGLELARTAVIPRQPVIDCADHLTQMWLHAEPALRRQLAKELLKPLFAEAPNSREILSETLLVWLETRASAPSIAARLGVHPQTVRYRWKRINELLGEILDEPETLLQLTMVLKASVPLWSSGNHDDFETEEHAS